MSEKNKRYSATQINAELFWKFPKFLLENKKYEKLSNDARVAYMLIKDRYRYSLSNQWVDDEGNVYVIFTVDQLKDQLHVSKTKAINIKKKLIEVDLLEIEKQGFNAKGHKNLPDKFYLLQPAYEAEDLISQTSQVGALEPCGGFKIGPRTQNEEILDNKGFSTCENCNNQPSALEPHGGFKIGPYKDKIPYKDTIIDTIIDTKPWDFSTGNYSKELVKAQNKDLLSHLDEFLNISENNPMFLNGDSLRLITMWVRTPQEASEFISVILNAVTTSRKNAKNQVGYHTLDFEEYGDELKQRVSMTLRRYFNKMRNDEGRKIKSPKNYLFRTMQNLFDEWQNEIMWNERKRKEEEAKERAKKDNKDNS